MFGRFFCARLEGSFMFERLLKRIGVVTKYDLNEYARRFIAGDDLPKSTVRKIICFN